MSDHGYEYKALALAEQAADRAQDARANVEVAAITSVTYALLALQETLVEMSATLQGLESSYDLANGTG